MAKKYGLNFDGVAELSEKLEALGGDLKATAEAALAFIPAEINPKLAAAMAKHRKTGKTAAAIVEGQKVTWSGNIASIDIGFDLKKGGFPSIYLMHGTPRHAPRNQYGGPVRPDAQENPGFEQDKELYNAIYGNKEQNEIKQRQAEIFAAAIARLMQ